MKFFLALIRWFLRSWPILIPVLAIALHYLAINQCVASITQINNFFALTLQLAGGALILYSIDSNLGIIQKTNIFGMVQKWLSENPIFKKPTPQTISVGSIASQESIDGIRAYSTPVTLEEKITLLQTQIVWIKEDLEKQSKSLEQSINELKTATFNETQSIKTQLSTLEGNFKDVSLGGTKLQIMGVIFIVHGTISSYLA